MITNRGGGTGGARGVAPNFYGGGASPPQNSKKQTSIVYAQAAGVY